MSAPPEVDGPPGRVLVADNPWPFKDALPGRGRGAAKHYRLLSIEEICTFPLPPLEDDAVLFLWRVASMQAEALEVIQAWGFNPPKSELVWLKRTPLGKRHFGMGRIVRNEHEVCLIATRGRIKVEDRGFRSTFAAPVGRHSEKPAVFYQIVERLYRGPYVELFARRRRPGWIQFGDQLPREGHQ